MDSPFNAAEAFSQFSWKMECLKPLLALVCGTGVGLLAACLVGVVLLENTYVLLACRFLDGTRGVVIPV